ncbi:MAG TPA: hypothetical protein VEV17_08545 [Bryobacteraceae bacterium]|nr:hypothetical protein [Bryobacteraceae bacterium]
MKNRLLLSGVWLAFAPAFAAAEVADSSSNGFTTKLTLHIQAAPDEVYRKLIRNVGDWWNSQHSFSGNAHNLSIEEKVMGCFCEKLPNQGGLRHMEVVFLAPGKKLVLSGALGPLQSLAATGSLAIDFSAADGGTKLNVTYAVAGYLPAGMNTWAAPVDSVITEQFSRLKNFVERGDPAPK